MHYAPASELNGAIIISSGATFMVITDALNVFDIKMHYAPARVDLVEG